MTSGRTVARRLATALVRGRLTQEAIVTRAGRVLGRRWRWLGPLARRIVARFGANSRPRHRVLEQFLRADPGFQEACVRHALKIPVELSGPPAMAPAPGAPQTWMVLPLLTMAELAGRLNLTLKELAWWSDLHRLERHLSAGPLRHYHYLWRRKRTGSVRLLESPKQRLKSIQRWILRQILERIPPHPAAHGFRQGRSIVTFAQPHVGQRAVLKLDLKEFFPSVRFGRVLAIFMTAGYPESVARALAGLCVNSAPSEVLNSSPIAPGRAEGRELKDRYEAPHLPQGAPTSPALANLAVFRLDCRLTGLADSVGATYTRYADDLVFSGDDTFAATIRRFSIQAGAIALEEGFELNMRKTRVMKSSVAQKAAGLVINTRLNVSRTYFDELKAILHNCVRHGPATQNRDGHPDFAAHLAGRIAHVARVHPGRGEKLMRLFNSIGW